MTLGAHERLWKLLKLAHTSEIGASMSLDWLVDGIVISQVEKVLLLLTFEHIFSYHYQ